MMRTRRFLLKTVIFAGTSLAGIIPFSLHGQLPGAKHHRSPVAPREELVKATVSEAYERFKNETSGKNADYIPALAKVDSKLFGIAVVSVDNQTFSIGDVTASFSIQSISKVFSLALAMEEAGAEKVFMKIGS